MRTKCIFSGTVDDLHLLLRRTDGIAILRQRFILSYSNEPGESEQGAWSNSLPALTSLLTSAGLGNIFCLIEFQMPGGARRCDVILLGEERGQPSTVVVELKQWTNVEVSSQHPDTVRTHGRRILHPVDQTAYYCAALKSFYPFLSEGSVTGSVWLHNMLPINADRLKARSGSVSEEVAVFSRNDGHRFLSFIRQATQEAPCSRPLIDQFLTAIPTPTPKLSSICSWLAADLARATSPILGPAPVSLTDEQFDLLDRFRNLVKSEEPGVLLVEGSSGSGKSLLAVLMLLHAVAEGKQSALALVNSHLIDILSRQLRHSLPVIRDLILNIGTQSPKRRNKMGLLATSRTLQVLICDEGQRISKDDVEALFSAKRSRLLVIFFDEHQRLLPTEGGTRAAFEEALKKYPRRVLSASLSTSVRCEGGTAYMQWVKTLVFNDQTKQQKQIGSSGVWRDCYEFRVFSKVGEMLAGLEQKRSAEGKSVALLAAYTKTDGSSPEQLPRWKDPLIKWRMGGQEYERFWLDEENGRLDTCASIYGSQGLEAHYVGLLWGKDLAFRKNRWELHPKHEITDSNGYLTLLMLIQDRKIEELISLLQNRYFIFLTRGIKGTYVHCEDEETADWLNQNLR